MIGQPDTPTRPGPLSDRDKVIITAIVGGMVFIYLMYIRPAPRRA